jgi:hypothetical protein
VPGAAKVLAVALALAALLPATGTPPAAGQVPALGPCQRAAELPPGAPVNVELATVTATEATITWLTCAAGSPAVADAAVTVYGPGLARRTFLGSPDTPYHLVRLTGLEPGTTYAYTVSSNGITAPVDRANPGAFTTLSPPPGNHLFAFAVLADIHVGEDVSGLATSSPAELPPGYRSERDYPEEMLAAAVDAINAGDASLTLVTADNSSHGQLAELRAARRLLDGLDHRYLVARGSHDRPNQYQRARKDCPGDGDCFRVVFRPGVKGGLEPRPRPAALVHRGYRFIALDSADPTSGQGTLGSKQLAWLERQLLAATRAEQPVVIFFHHPVAEYSTTAAVPPAIFGVNQADAQALLELIGRFDVRLVINAHTHRNWIAYSPRTGRMPIIETGPTKEYPGGYTLIDVYEGGLMRTWHPIDCRFCNAWRETTRGEYFTLYPYYTLGSVRDRNFTHVFEGPDVPGVPSLPLGLWPPGLPPEA